MLYELNKSRPNVIACNMPNLVTFCCSVFIFLKMLLFSLGFLPVFESIILELCHGSIHIF